MTNPPQKIQDADGFYFRLEHCKSPIRIAKQITEDGKRRYAGFDTFDDVCSFVKSNKNNSLHEVTRCGEEGIQRVFMDIDAKQKDFGHINRETINRACEILIQSAYEILYYNGVTNPTHIELVSHRADKFSKHVVFTNAYINVFHYECFYKQLSEAFASNLMVENLPLELVNIIDANVYETRHCLRLHTSFKFGSDVRLKLRNPETGIIEQDGKFDPETMVTYIPKDQTTIQLYNCPDGCTGVTKKEYEINASDDHLKIACQILDSMTDEGISVAKLDKPFIRLNVDHSKPCPVCQQKHESENVMAVVSSKDLKLICRRKEKGQTNRYKVLHTFGRFIDDVPVVVDEIKSINVIKTNANWLSPLDEILNNCDRLFIKSDMGSRKSTRVHEYIAKMLKLDPDYRCVFLTYRINLAASINAAAKKANPDIANPFEKYNDITRYKISLNEHNRLIIQLESLNRLDYDLEEPIDLLVVDEAVSFCQQSIAGLRKEMTLRNQMTLRNLLRNSKKTVIMDALIDTPAIEAYQCLLPKDRQTLWINTAVNQWAPEVEKFNCAIKCRQQLSERLKAGKRIYISITNGEKAVKQLERYILKQKADLKVLTIYGGGEDNEFIVSNINEELSKYDVVIASPCMSAGISFDVKDHFDEVYAFIDNKGPSAIDIIQSLRRVRHTKNNKIVLCNISSKVQLPTSYQDIFNDEQQRLKFNSQDFINDGFNLEIDKTKCYFANPDSPGLKWRFHCTRIGNLNKVDRFGTVEKYLLSQGANFVKVVDKNEDEQTKVERKEFKEDGVEVKKDISIRIAKTSVISEDEYDAIRSNGKVFTGINHDKPQGITESDIDLMKKFQLLRHYGLHIDYFAENNRQTRIAPFNNSEFVEKYSKEEVKECYTEMIYRNLSDEQVKAIDDTNTADIESDEGKTDHHYLFGRHVMITRIRDLFDSGTAECQPVVDYVKEHHKMGNPLLKRYKEITNANVVTAVNKIMSPYGYKVHKKKVGGKTNRRQILELEDHSLALFVVKSVPFNTDDLTIEMVRQSGASEMPVAVVYEK